jgi:23S rRNA pseudouridine2604 synthase
MNRKPILKRPRKAGTSNDAASSHTRAAHAKPADRHTTPAATAAPRAGIRRPPRVDRQRTADAPTADEPCTASAATADGRIRLSKLMSQRGIASRREADEWIAKGWVRVDGEVVTELGSRVLPSQEITIERAAREQQQARVTILMNKPLGYVSGQAEDGHTPAAVLFKAENRWEGDKTLMQFHPLQAKGLAPAGRLDIDSVGLIVFTQDGRIAKQLIGEDSAIEKEYLVRVVGTLAADGLKKLNHGLSLDGKPLKPAKVSWQNEDQLRFVLREGKKRQIRRMCELVGLKVVGLKRIRIGKITLGALPVGRWRYLAANESFA